MRKMRIGLLCLCLLLFSVLHAGMADEAKELVPNGGFEEIADSGDPKGWTYLAYYTEEAYSRLEITHEAAHTGDYSAVVENTTDNDSRWVTTIAVEPESLYRLSGYVMVESMEDWGFGANLSVEGINAPFGGLFDTQGQWQYVESYGKTGPRQRVAVIGARVGGYSEESVGKAYFDDISIVKVDAVPAGTEVIPWYRSDEDAVLADGKELLPNGGFERVNSAGLPQDWHMLLYKNQEGYSQLSVTGEKARTGEYSALVESASENDARWVATVAVEPESMYRLSGYVWVDTMGDAGMGANLSVEGVYVFSQAVTAPSQEWQYVELYGETGPRQREIQVAARIGGYGAENIGRAYFDDISLVKVNTLPGHQVAALLYRDSTPASVEGMPEEASTEKNLLLFAALALAFCVMALLVQRHMGRGKATGNGVLKDAQWTVMLGVMLLAALAVRIVLGGTIAGHQVDMNCFTQWSLRMAAVGPGAFYSPDYFCDYPPGYILLLWPVGVLLNGLSGPDMAGQYLLVKCIPILCDIAVAVFLFMFVKKRFSTKVAFFAALLFAFNPAALLNGAAWGQVDTLLALFLLLVAYYAMERRWKMALPFYAAAALVKPQALLLAPVGLLWLVGALLRHKEKKQRQDVLWGLLAAIGVVAAVSLPFAVTQKNPLLWIIELYTATLSSYAYATINTANLYYLLGANWKPLESMVHRAVPLVAGIGLLGFGVWQAKLYAGFGYAKEAIEKARQEVRASGEISTPSNQFLLAALCGGAGLAFVVMTLTGCSYQVFGTAMMIFVFAWTLLGVLTDQDMRRLPFYMALVLIGVFVLGIKMHERYLFVALPLLLMAYATTGDKRLLGLFAGFTVTTFLNAAIILSNDMLYGSVRGHLNADTLGVNVVLCLANMALCGYAGYISFVGLRESRAYTPEGNAQSPSKQSADQSYHRALLSPGDERLNLGIKDWAIMGIVTVVYACMSLTNLGSLSAPQNGWVSTAAEEEIVFELERDEPYHFLYYAGVSYNPFSISTSEDGERWSEPYLCNMREGMCYQWKYAIHTLPGSADQFAAETAANRVLLQGKYLRLNAKAAGLNLLEVLARNEAGQPIPMKVIGHAGAKPDMLLTPRTPESLLDEGDTLQGEPGWFNSMYFDEIYHARTGYEHLHGIKAYEWTHPPLGKLLMSASIAVFGMTPFGWRFAGAMTGVFMLPALYLLAKQILRRRELAALAMLLFTFDLMHFTQTRIATIDSFPVFFIMLSYLCMARYVMTDVFALEAEEPERAMSYAFWKSMIPLALSGFFMGLSIASKWIGVYSAVGLAVLFFTAVYRQYRVGSVAFQYAAPEKAKALTQEQQRRVAGAQNRTLRRILITCGFCVVFFVLVPLAIYYVSYIPFFSPTGPITFRRLIAEQERMLDYHATPGLGMDHPYQSPWWQWPFILKPMWFALDMFEPEGFASTIMCIGNPLIFYVGAVCMVLLLGAFVSRYVSLRGGISRKGTDGNMALPVIVIGFLAQYLPWVLVPRSMFIYHYFASVPFVILATCWVASFLPQGKPRLRYGVIIGYVVLAVVFFVMFYPYASGMLTSLEWLNAMRWFPGLAY